MICLMMQDLNALKNIMFVNDIIQKLNIVIVEEWDCRSLINMNARFLSLPADLSRHTALRPLIRGSEVPHARLYRCKICVLHETIVFVKILQAAPKANNCDDEPG